MNPTGWIPRQVDAPAGDMLNRGEVAKLFGVSDATIRRLVESGEFPAPLVLGRQGQVWDWESVAYYRLRLRLGNRVPCNGAKLVTTDPESAPTSDK